jgi:inosine-uridine nucleoside N-ribohydrolase
MGTLYAVRITAAGTVVALLSTTLGFGLASTVSAAPLAPGSRECVVIDTDFDFDDLMAIPPVVAQRDVRAIVTTEGVTRPGPAAGAIRVLLKRGDVGARPEVIVGAPSVAPHGPDEHPWLPRLRSALERLNNWLPSLRPAPSSEVQQGRSGAFAKRVVRAVEGCRSIDLLIIGPFSSFNVYAPAIEDRIDEVVLQGKPLYGDPLADPEDLTFNCEYDMPSCEAAFPRLDTLRSTWVEVTRDVDPPYAPSIGMVRALRDTGLPGALERALLADQTTWRPKRLPPGGKSLLWDQLAALYLLEPDNFTPVGGHMETTLTPQQVRRAWTAATNG